MNIQHALQTGVFALIGLLSGADLSAQVLIRGTVYDRSQLRVLQGVSVMSASGSGTATDSAGHYSIKLNTSDSISFSYLGKSTAKFPVKQIEFPLQFDMSLEVGVDSLPTVLVQPKNYYLDSLQNRQEYQKVFDYGGGGALDNLKTGKGRAGIGMGFDFDMILNPKKERRMLALQKRLVEEEQDKYVDHRFTRAVVRRVTGLESPALDTFMRLYRPGYDFLKSFETDWEYYEYIQTAGRSFITFWKQDHPDWMPPGSADQVSEQKGKQP